jgi:hypothetical protein
MSIEERGFDDPAHRPIIEAFPMPGVLVEGAYKRLQTVSDAPETVQRVDLGIPLMPRPWDPPTCRDPLLRAELWDWLERVVIWLNHEYVWDTEGMIPACWVHHPHLVHDLAVVADRRRRAGLSLTSADLEEWHRYVLSDFFTRMSTRLRSHCNSKDHQPWPVRGRFVRHCSPESTEARQRLFAADVGSLVEHESDHEERQLDPDERRARIHALPDPPDEDEVDSFWRD